MILRSGCSFVCNATHIIFLLEENVMNIAHTFISKCQKTTKHGDHPTLRYLCDIHHVCP